MRKQRDDGVFRITGARQSLAEDVRGRQRRYVISMLIRTVSVILAAVLWNVERHVAVVALAAGILLPYVAVVIANAGRENVPTLPSAVSAYVAPHTRPMLPPPAAAGGATGEAAGGAEARKEPWAESRAESSAAGRTEQE